TAGTGLSGGGSSGTVTLNVANGGIGATQLADSAVTSAKIAGGTIADSDISASAPINPAKISGTAAQLGSNSLHRNQTISSGNLNIPNTTGSNSGVISVDGVPFIHNFGSNAFLGINAGNFLAATNTLANTGIGNSALAANTTGGSNTATGAFALSSNTT